VSPKSRGRKKKPGKNPGKRQIRPEPAAPVVARHEGSLSSSTAAAPSSAAGAAPLRQRDLRDIDQAAEGAYAVLHAEAERFRPLAGDAADPLEVEVRAAELMARYEQAHPSGMFGLGMGLVVLAARNPEPHVAAMAAAVDCFLPGMATSMALGDLARRGVPLPAWRERLGEVVPGKAWRYRDVFGDQEAVLVSFSYQDAEHAILVETTTCPAPSVRVAQVSATVGDLHTRLQASAEASGEQLVLEEIPLEQARTVLGTAVRRPHRDAGPESLVFLPIARRRIECLPDPGPVEEATYTKADRAAAVEAFLAAGPQPAGVDRDVLAFWARAVVGYTAVSGSPPTRIGPVWLGYALGEHVPRAFELSPAQRAGLGPSVTAWAAWAARQQDLPEAALDRLAARVADIEQKYDRVHADPDLVAIRCYLADVAAVTADGEDLRRAFALRAHAVPTPERRSPEARSLLAADRAQRHRILAEELESWQLSPELSAQDWFEALIRVSDQLWNQDPPELAEAAWRYLDEGSDPDLLGDLTELCVDHQGDMPAFMAAAQARLTPDPEY
jgi:hypothetical protein